jgi:hypothetical protein
VKEKGNKNIDFIITIHCNKKFLYKYYAELNMNKNKLTLILRTVIEDNEIKTYLTTEAEKNYLEEKLINKHIYSPKIKI